MRKATLLAALTALMTFAPAHAQQDDAMLSTLRSELDYYFKKLCEQPLKPYFMSYRVTDSRNLSLASDMGLTDGPSVGMSYLPPYTHTVTLVPQIRVGDYQLDNFKYSKTSGAIGVSTWSIPYEYSAKECLQANIWSATENKYKLATSAYEAARLRQSTDKTPSALDSIPSYSKAPVEKHYEAPLPHGGIGIDTAVWQRRLNDISRVFCHYPWLATGTATMKVGSVREYIVNTDGTEVVQNRRSAYVTITAVARTKDGWNQPLSHTYFAFSADSLPAEAVMVAKAKELAERVSRLLKAPRGTAYSGPAILSGAAAGVLFHEVLGHRIEAHRYGNDSETFDDMRGTQVLPKSFSVVSDPTLRSLGGQDLNGAYLYDDEGVKAQRVECIKNGSIVNVLSSRIPSKNMQQSNGHGRTDGDREVVARQSNLISTTATPVSESNMRQQLINLCRKQGKEYGYYIKSVNSGYTLTGENGSINSFKVQPIESYRIYVDGRPDELVRDLQLIGTPLNMFSNIVAGGSQLSTFVGECGAESGYVPVTSSAPTVLVSKLETQVGGNGKKYNQTELDDPVITEQVMGNDSTVIFRAMQDEVKRQMDSLVIDGKKPFLIKTRVDRARSFYVKSELGGTTALRSVPFCTTAGANALAGDYRLAAHVKNLAFPVLTSLTPDYAALRRALNSAIGIDFDLGVQNLSWQNKALKEKPLPQGDTIPNLFPTASIDYSAPVRPCHIDEQKLQGLSKRMSAMFIQTPHLFDTKVEIKVNDRLIYTLTSEGVRMIQPVQNVAITVNASFRTAMQTVDKNSLWLTYRTPDEIPSDDSLRVLMQQFIADCEALRTAPPMDKYYEGPMMLEDWVWFQTLRGNYLKDNGLFARPGSAKPERSFGEKTGFPIADKRLSFTHYTNLTSWSGQPLFGHYEVDADGVRPVTKLSLIEKGVLRNVLSEGRPAWFCPTNTGNSRFQESVFMATSYGIGTLVVNTEKKKDATPEDKMTKKLVELAKKQGLEYAYVFSQPPYFTRARIYRVDLKTGERTMMMTNRAQLPATEKLKELLAVSRELQVTNYAEPYTFSMIYPKSVILDMAVNPSNFTATTPPLLTYPLLREEK